MCVYIYIYIYMSYIIYAFYNTTPRARRRRPPRGGRSRAAAAAWPRGLLFGISLEYQLMNSCYSKGFPFELI